MQRVLRGGGGFRTYTLMLCVFYLFVVFLFHASLQPQQPRGISDHAHDDDLDPDPDLDPKKKVDGEELLFPPALNDVKVAKAELAPGAVKHDVNAGQAGAVNGVERMEQDDGKVVKAPPPPVEQAPQPGKAAAVIVSPPLPCSGPDVEERPMFVEVAADIRIYSVYWDERPNDFDNLSRGYYLRMMAVIQSRSAHMKRAVYCIFGGEGENAIPVLATYYEMCENHNRPYGGYILSCVVPVEIKQPPCTVLVSQSTEASKGHRFKVQSTVARETRRDFAVCVSPLFGTIDPLKLVEWLELTKILGAQHINFYHTDLRVADSVIKRILEYYISTGFVSVVDWPLGDDQDRNMWYHGQLVAVQDCLYRNMATAKYVAFNDLDEFMVPHVHGNWSAMMAALDDGNTCGFQLHSAFFDPGRQDGTAPPQYKHFWTLSDTKRSVKTSRVRTKCLIKAQHVFEAGIHHISKPIYANLQTQRLDLPAAVLHHYRTCMANYGMDCALFEDDRTIPTRFDSPLITSVNAVLRELRGELVKFSFDAGFKKILEGL